MAILWKWSALAVDCTTADFTADNADTNSFKIIEKIAGQTGDNGIKNI